MSLSRIVYFVLVLAGNLFAEPKVLQPQLDVAKKPFILEDKRDADLTIRMVDGDKYFKYASFADFGGGGHWQLDWKNQGDYMEAQLDSWDLTKLVLSSDSNVVAASGHMYIYHRMVASGDIVIVTPEDMPKLFSFEIVHPDGSTTPDEKTVGVRITHQHSAGGYGSYHMYKFPQKMQMHTNLLPSNMTVVLNSQTETADGVELAYVQLPYQQDSGDLSMGKKGYATVKLQESDVTNDYFYYVSLWEGFSLYDVDAGFKNIKSVKVAMRKDMRPQRLSMAAAFAPKSHDCGTEALTYCAMRLLGRNYARQLFLIGEKEGLTLWRSGYDSSKKQIFYYDLSKTQEKLESVGSALIPTDRALLAGDHFIENASSASDGHLNLVGKDVFKYQLERLDEASKNWELVPMDEMIPGGYASAQKWLITRGLPEKTHFRFTRTYNASGFSATSVLNFTNHKTGYVLPSLGDFDLVYEDGTAKFIVWFNFEDMPTIGYKKSNLNASLRARLTGTETWTDVAVSKDPKIEKLYTGNFPILAKDNDRFDVEITAVDEHGNKRVTTINSLR